MHATLAPGTHLGRYEIEALIGAGGMGEVYRARDADLERPVALKVLAPGLAGDPEHEARMLREAQAASVLNHPNILVVYEVGHDAGRRFVAAELVEGRSLRALLRQGPLALPEALDVAVQVASALAAAEAAGLVHADVKPENVMVRPDGWVKVLDFGLARFRRGAGRLGPGDVAPAGGDSPVLRGTVPYMSPEQLRDEELDSRSDVWGVGLVLHEMLTGRPRFAAPTPTESILAILGSRPPQASAELGAPVPPELDGVLAGAMAPDRGGRYASVAILLRELAALRDRHRPGRSRVLPAAGPPSPAVDGEVPTDVLADTSGGGVPPPPPAGFVGRDEELAVLVGWLRAGVRLVTLTGPGGAGKTSLALAAAAAARDAFADGVVFVPLAAVRDADLLTTAMAVALGVPPGAASAAAVEERLRDRRILLLLDNFEQLAPAATRVARLLATAPGVAALVTSREPLRLRQERELPVPPLAVPADRTAPTDAIAAHASVALFVERARAALPGFRLDPTNAPAVAEICARLDGLPLAIELAAARVKILPPRAMLARLDRRLEILVGGARDLPARQRTMRGAIAWGYQLLTPAEQALFRRLAVFAGGFRLEAAERVVRAGELGLDLLEGVASLVDKSFLRRREGEDGEPRFHLLGTLRDYGLERLEEAGEREATEALHSRFHLDLARRAAPRLVGAEQTAWLARLDEEHDDLRAVLARLVAATRTETAIDLAASLWWFWYLRGHYAEGGRWLEATLRLGGSPESRARALLGSGALALLSCDYVLAAERLAEGAALAREQDDLATLAACLQFQGSVARERGDCARAVALHGESRELWRRLGDEREVGRSHNYVALAAWLGGDVDTAEAACADTLALFRRLGDAEGLAWALLVLGAVARGRGAAGRARALWEEALRLSRDGLYREGEAWALDLLGRLALDEGEPERAAAFLRRSLRLHRDLGDRWRTASVLEALAARAAPRDPAGAARLLGAADGLRAALSAPVPVVERPDRDATAALLAATLGADLPVHDAEGRATPLAAAVERALAEG